LIQIFITKEEERALGIQEQVTTGWRRQNNIPDSDDFEIYLQGPQGTDLTQYPQLILTSMMAKDTS
jgi:hypothetical protein